MNNDRQANATIDEVYKLVKENNRMLKSMRRGAFIKGVFGFVWWVFILIVLPYLTYLYLKPYLDQAVSVYSEAQGTADAVNAKLQGLPDLSRILEQFGLDKPK